MLSRVADSIYWLNRYVERAENVARFVDVNLNLLLDTPVGMAQQWEPLIVTTGDRDEFLERYGEATAEDVLHFLTFDRKSSNSIISSVKSARENARSVRETISSEVWEQVNSFYLMVEEAAQNEADLDLYSFYPKIKLASHLFSGVMDATMSHSEGWHFGRMGRLLERADKTARILDVKYYILLPSIDYVGSPLDDLLWISLLKSASAYEMYRKLHKRITPSGITQFLIFNRDFPRSIQYCLLGAEDSLHQISGTPLGKWRLDSERTLGRLRASLEYSTLEDILAEGLHEYLDGFQANLNQVDFGIYKDFIALPLETVA